MEFQKDKKEFTPPEDNFENLPPEAASTNELNSPAVSATRRTLTGEELRDILLQVREELELENPHYEKLPPGRAKELAKRSQERIAAMSEDEKRKFLEDWNALDDSLD